MYFVKFEKAMQSYRSRRLQGLPPDIFPPTHNLTSSEIVLNCTLTSNSDEPSTIIQSELSMHNENKGGHDGLNNSYISGYELLHTQNSSGTIVIQVDMSYCTLKIQVEQVPEVPFGLYTS